MKPTSRQCTYKIQCDLKVASFSWTKDKVNLWINTFNKNERSLKMDFMHDHKLCSSTDIQVFFKYMSFKGYTSVCRRHISVPQQFLKGMKASLKEHTNVPQSVHEWPSRYMHANVPQEIRKYHSRTFLKCPSRYTRLFQGTSDYPSRERRNLIYAEANICIEVGHLKVSHAAQKTHKYPLRNIQTS